MPSSKGYSTKASLFDGLSRLSYWPDEPYRAWTHPGCRFSIIECWQYKDTSKGYFDYSILETSKATESLSTDSNVYCCKELVAGIKILVIEGSVDSLDPMVDTYDISAERSVPLVYHPQQELFFLWSPTLPPATSFYSYEKLRKIAPLQNIWTFHIIA